MTTPLDVAQIKQKAELRSSYAKTRSQTCEFHVFAAKLSKNVRFLAYNTKNDQNSEMRFKQSKNRKKKNLSERTCRRKSPCTRAPSSRGGPFPGRFFFPVAPPPYFAERLARDARALSGPDKLKAAPLPPPPPPEKP